MPRYVGQRIPQIQMGGELVDDVLVDVRDPGEFAAGHAPDAWSIPMDRLCRACFDGVYPIELPDADLLGKHLLEGIERRAELAAHADGPLEVGRDAAGLTTLLAGGGADDALSRP